MVSAQPPLAELTRDESLRLLASVAMGRVVFTDQVLPVVRPVNHLLDDGGIVIRSDLGSALVRAAARPDGVVVAYEADAIDPHWTAGWSVVVTGTAHLVRDPAKVAGYHRLLQPWVAGNMDQIIRIGSEIVTGFRLPGDDRGVPPPVS